MEPDSTKASEIASGPQLQSEPAVRLLGALRRAGNEPSWTKAIAAVASDDVRFAAALARLLVDRAAGGGAGITVPDELECRAEVPARTIDGRSLGIVDLVFSDERRSFCLYVELKLHSGYGDRQLHRYLEGLDSEAAPRQALVAITTATPLCGEEALDGDPRWLGSLRWAALYDGLLGLPVADATAGDIWRSLLRLLRAQGDFGVMDIDIDDIRAWARFVRTEEQLRTLLRELEQPTEAFLREYLPRETSTFAHERPNQHIVPHRLRPHLAYRVPAECGEERLRIQFHGSEGVTRFAVEARYQHPNEPLETPEIRAATEALEAKRFTFGNDGWGYYWSRSYPTEEFAHPTDTQEKMVKIVRDAIAELAASGIFSALDRHQPQTPQVKPEPDSPQG